MPTPAMGGTPGPPGTPTPSTLNLARNNAATSTLSDAHTNERTPLSSRMVSVARLGTDVDGASTV